jgi:predicted nucleotidyltransferase
MQPILEARRKELAELCRRFRVRRLDVFGSAAGGAFDPSRSDVDFLVEFERDPPGKALDAFFGFRDALQSLLGRPVDLVMAGAVANPYLKAGIEQTRETVFAA